MRYYEHEIPVYGHESDARIAIYLFKGKQDYIECVSHAEERYDVFDDDNTFLSFGTFRAYVTTLTSKNGHENFAMFIDNSRPFTIYTLIHECLHVMSAVFISRGVSYDEHNDEVMTYFLETIVKMIHKDILDVVSIPVIPKKRKR